MFALVRVGRAPLLLRAAVAAAEASFVLEVRKARLLRQLVEAQGRGRDRDFLLLRTLVAAAAIGRVLRVLTVVHPVRALPYRKATARPAHERVVLEEHTLGLGRHLRPHGGLTRRQSITALALPVLVVLLLVTLEDAISLVHFAAEVGLHGHLKVGEPVVVLLGIAVHAGLLHLRRPAAPPFGHVLQIVARLEHLGAPGLPALVRLQQLRYARPRGRQLHKLIAHRGDVAQVARAERCLALAAAEHRLRRRARQEAN
mmetsp:Transcript_17476/g.54150  ORF Transcript_17476/g.54150 Transcript_17476/m.54150 type:complete len:257 (+) Transcript_17476:1032-1802(+)